MRAFLLILTALSVLACAGMSALSFTAYAKQAEKAESAMKMLDELGDKAPPQIQTLGEQLSGFERMSNAAIVVALFSLVFLVLTFLKKAKPQLIVGGLMASLSVVIIVISPSFETGKYGGMDAKTQAMIWGGAAVLALTFGILAEKKRQV